jgi:solute carrier family 25 carnitine/acylcarnitine transporter 20/29
MSQTEVPTLGVKTDMGSVEEIDKGPAPRHLGFVAGVFSGVTKLAVGHPFDTIKVRLQTASSTKFSGAWDCILQTARNEGIRGFYKGATPPLLGWMVMDSIMLGSLHVYRRHLKETFYPNEKVLPLLPNSLAGVLAGWTVSFVAAPIEHVKARLQVQYDAQTRLYYGPIDCTRSLIRQRGVFRGLYKGLFATMLFRTNFFFWWGSYDVISTLFKQHTNMSTAAINFWAGGLGATVFWCTAFPSDVVKQQILTDDVVNPKYKSWWSAAKDVRTRYGWKGYFRGFAPCIIRSFPANAAALAAFEAVMRFLH